MSEAYGFDEDWLEGQRRRVTDIERIQGSMITCFSAPAGQEVLAYLYDFCRAGLPTYVRGDPHHSAYNEGKRRVLLQIQGFLQMDDEELFRQARSQARARAMEDR